MKKYMLFFPIALVLLLTSCSGKDKTTENTSTDNGITAENEDAAMEKEIVIDNKVNGETADKDVSDDTANSENLSGEDLSTEEVSNEVTKDDNSTNEANKIEITTVNTIPSEYLMKRTDHYGSIEKISYQTKDYFGDGSEITKSAYVYLPENYDESKQYNVLYLMHGIGGSENEWGMNQDSSQVKIMMDNLIYNNEIDPFIIVTPNGRSSADFANSSSDHNSFYVFGKELRNDLIPYIESKYSTYAEYDENGYDLTAARDHRAMAGLSMGGMQTINIGMCENLDIISYFGAFSACPTTNTASKISEMLKSFPDNDIHFFYNICGTEDSIAFPSASAAIDSLTDLTDKLSDGDNFIWQTVSGGHDFNVWYLGFFNFARIAFQR